MDTAQRSGRIQPRWLTLAWWVLAVPTWTIVVASIPFYAGLNLNAFTFDLVVPLDPIVWFFIGASLVLSLATALFSLLLSAVLYFRRPQDRMALFLSLYLLLYGASMAGPLEMLDPLLPGSAAFNTRILIPGLVAPATHLFFLVFPDGRIAPRWSRWLLGVTVLASPLYVIESNRIASQIAITGPVPQLFYALAIAAGLVGWVLLPYVQIYRYRYIYTHEQRQQTKWLVYGLGVWLVLQAGSSIPWMQAQVLPPGSTLPLSLAAGSTIWILSVAIIPATLAVAVLRYRLYDIDLIINRTLVYGVLTAVVVALYVLVVGGLSTFLQMRGSLAISLLGTGLIAVLLQPLRERLQRFFNRLIFGDRDDPAALLARLGQRLEAAGEPDAVPRAIVETIIQALKLPYAAIEVTEDGSSIMLAEAGETSVSRVKFTVVYQSQEVGHLIAAPRPPEEAFSAADERVLRQVATQAGSALYAVQLTHDLRLSRARIVSTREEERRRLRRDLHDGLGPTLASQSLKLAAARRVLADQPARAQDLLDDVLARNEGIISEVRQLVYDLRPPSLDELGLVGAIREYLHGPSVQGGLQVSVTVPDDGLPPLGAAVEVAAFRITLEALTNVYRHAQARHCEIDFNLSDGHLQVAIRDDGMGLPAACQPGVGLTSMHERAEEIGGSLSISSQPAGGTAVIAALPVEVDS